MPANIHTYLYGRLLLLTGSTQDKREYIHDALTAEVSVESGKFHYMIAEVENLTSNGELFVSGILVKYKQLLEGEVVDEATKRLLTEGLPQGVVSKSPFFLHYASSVLSYRPISGRISNRQFKNIFARLIEAGQDDFFVSAKVESIDEEIKLREAIIQLAKIFSVSIDVHPTNPGLRPIYKPLDERLDTLEAARMRQTVDSEERGLDKNALLNDETYQGVVMAVDGYGEASVKGEDSQGRKVTVRTTDSPVTQQVVDSADRNELLNGLYRGFERIWQRFADEHSDKV